MGPRLFARAFKAQVGQTPAKANQQFALEPT